MRCEEIQERFVEALYDEYSGSPESADLREHLRTCAACRAELDELKQTRKSLGLWRDEPPLQSIAVAGRKPLVPAASGWGYLRYAAIAALAVISLLAIANTQVKWNKEEFSFSARLWPAPESGKDYYTKDEVRDLLKRSLEDSESRTNETNYLMMQKVLDTVEQDRWMDLNLIRNTGGRYQNKN